ncbi:MAG: ParB N-terminal domain-containing protein [Thermoguttaceae bacterium]|nr:ParB N-terminal domain-containing protein [Thermoguttaceae bacterium]MBP3693629.1 ParB N-terminal domain-containing protein [Thermoguttaceae bacterium]
MSLVRKFKVAEIQTRPDIQVRCGMNEDAVERYADLYREGVSLTPVSIWHDRDGNLILIDGHHRLEAAKRAGLEEIDGYDEGTGDMSGFIEESIKANARNGLALSKADRKRAAELIYKYQPTLSVRSIADKVGLSKSLIQTIVSEVDAQTNAKCALCRAKVLKIYAEEKSSGWIQTFDNGKEFWFCSEEHRAEYWAKVQERAEAARLRILEDREPDREPQEVEIPQDREPRQADCASAQKHGSVPDGHSVEDENVPEVEIPQDPDDFSNEKLAEYRKILKDYPCPFCGETPLIATYQDTIAIWCGSDCAMRPGTKTCSTFEEALEDWRPRGLRSSNDAKPEPDPKLETFLRKGYCWSAGQKSILLQLIDHDGNPSIGLEIKGPAGLEMRRILMLPEDIFENEDNGENEHE